MLFVKTLVYEISFEQLEIFNIKRRIFSTSSLLGLKQHKIISIKLFYNLF